ncbi:hypothetical protein BDN72DRAFT_964627 [Pluteus cervinus]|uniref:Uncharacterized protein n=1 Tax=Pluteus cervinus TaxID=181527 RepID=A0ACD3A904_9AGAR|nr:hypothetical protein BDN72DRAFT_964627 [Pluteus cervinus]
MSSALNTAPHHLETTLLATSQVDLGSTIFAAPVKEAGATSASSCSTKVPAISFRTPQHGPNEYSLSPPPSQRRPSPAPWVTTTVLNADLRTYNARRSKLEHTGTYNQVVIASGLGSLGKSTEIVPISPRQNSLQLRISLKIISSRNVVKIYTPFLWSQSLAVSIRQRDQFGLHLAMVDRCLQEFRAIMGQKLTLHLRSMEVWCHSE